MDSFRIVIVALSAACVLVACLIVVVLRRPAPGKKRHSHVDDEEANTLARIDAVRPAPSKPALNEPVSLPVFPPSEPAPYGRMPGMPDSPQRMDRRNGPPPAARIPDGPLPFERVAPQAGRGNGLEPPIERPRSGELPMRAAPNGSGTLGTPPANRPAFPQAAYGGGNGNVGRMPGFVPANTSPALGSGATTSEQPAEAPEQRRLGALARVYAEGIQVGYDSGRDVIDVVFSTCPMRSREEAELAFRVLLAKVRTVLKPLGRDRAALLMDVAGLERASERAPVWNESLKAFLLAACEQVVPGRLLIVRYDSRAVGSRQEVLAHIQGATPAMVWNLQSTVFGSREEAAALLARLREPAVTPN